MDRWLRAFLGIVVITLGVGYQSWWGALGIIFLATAGMSWCPIYAIFGLRTCPLRADNH